MIRRLRSPAELRTFSLFQCTYQCVPFVLFLRFDQLEIILFVFFFISRDLKDAFPEPKGLVHDSQDGHDDKQNVDDDFHFGVWLLKYARLKGEMDIADGLMGLTVGAVARVRGEEWAL